GGRRGGVPVPILPRPTQEGENPLPRGRSASSLRGRGARSPTSWQSRARRAPGRVGAKQGGKRINLSYNKQCAKCNQREARSDRRFLLCRNDPNCRKWIHNKHCRPSFNTFVEDESKRCCEHHRETVTKTKCNCCSCIAWRRKQSAPGEGWAVVRGGAAGRHGKGRGHAGRTGGRGGSSLTSNVLCLPRAQGDTTS
ncbi:unnamed protein product, partial [Ectocarpus sp. 8 AP-2014]